jgi:hypothetical protein
LVDETLLLVSFLPADEKEEEEEGNEANEAGRKESVAQRTPVDGTWT